MASFDQPPTVCGPVVQKVDNVIHWINHYPVRVSDFSGWQTYRKSLGAVHWSRNSGLNFRNFRMPNGTVFPRCHENSDPENSDLRPIEMKNSVVITWIALRSRNVNRQQPRWGVKIKTRHRKKKTRKKSTRKKHVKVEPIEPPCLVSKCERTNTENWREGPATRQI